MCTITGLKCCRCIYCIVLYILHMHVMYIMTFTWAPSLTPYILTLTPYLQSDTLHTISTLYNMHTSICFPNTLTPYDMTCNHPMTYDSQSLKTWTLTAPCCFETCCVFSLGFICNCLSCFTTGKISFTSILFHSSLIWSLSYTPHIILFI